MEVMIIVLNRDAPTYSVGGCVTKRTWIVDIDGRQHIIHLNHDYWLGKRQIWLDDVLIEEGRKFFDSGTVDTKFLQ